MSGMGLMGPMGFVIPILHIIPNSMISHADQIGATIFRTLSTVTG